MPLPIVLLDAVASARTVAELMDVLLRVLNLQSGDVERLERKWDIKQHADFQAAVQLLRLARIDAKDSSQTDVVLLKNGLGELLKSWNYYADLQRKKVLDKAVELELVYVISSWLIAQCYLKIQEIEGRPELIDDALQFYILVMQIVHEKIYRIRNPEPPQPVRFFHKVDNAIFNFIASGSLPFRIIKSLIILTTTVFYIGWVYWPLDIAVRILGSGICGKPKADPVILDNLNRLYLKSIVEVSPYANRLQALKLSGHNGPKQITAPP